MVTPTHIEIAARVRRFTPRRLDAVAWAAAREAVVQAVLAANPPTLLEADYYCTHLTLFLAGLSREKWDQVSAPDVAQLLTSTAIDVFTSEMGMPGKSKHTRQTARTRLRQLQRGVLGRTKVASSPRAASKKASGFWMRVTGLAPFTALAEAYRTLGGSLHITAWMEFAESLSTDLLTMFPAANATALPVGTLRGVQMGAEALREVKAPQGVSLMATQPTSSTPAAKPMSRAAALRMARAAQTTAPAPQLAPAPALATELQTMVDGWCPQGVSAQVWAPVAAAAATAMAAYAPASKSSLMNIRSAIADYCLWVHARRNRVHAGDLTVEELVAEGALEAYFAGPLADRPDATQSTIRSVLRRVVRKLAPQSQPMPISYQPVQPPYTEAECVAFVLLARNQPTEHLRRELSALVALGLGAGLSAEDSRLIAPCHVRELQLGSDGLALAVRVPADGPRGRVVVLRREYESLLREALALHKQARRGASTPLYGVNPRRRNGANRVTEKAVTAMGQGVNVSAARLRTTWLVAAMSSPVPFGALLHASGLRTPRTLTDLLPFCPAPDPTAVALALQIAGSSANAQVAS